MAIQYAICNIQMKVGVQPKPTRMRCVSTDLSITSWQAAGALSLTVDGANLIRVIELMTVYVQSDEEIARVVRNSVLRDETEGKTDAEIACEVRANVVKELQEMG